MKRGSITVFLCLYMTVCLGVTGALLEGSRLYGARAILTMSQQMASGSVQASYNRELWEKYDLLLWDGEGGSNNKSLLQEEYQDWLEEALTPSWYGLYLYGMQAEETELTAYHTLLEDGGKHMLFQMLDAEESDQSSVLLEYMNGVLDFLPATSLPDSGFSLDGLLEDFTLWQVLEKGTAVSDYRIHASNLPSAELASGCRENILEKLMANQYILNHFDSYTDSRTEGLCYQVEYILNGSEKDSLNLVSAARTLIHMRTALNLVKIFSEPQMQQAADLAALLLSAVLTVPEGKDVVKILIELVWAYAEGVQDVQDLLAGKCVPLQKETSQWHLWLHVPEELSDGTFALTDLLHIQEIISGWLQEEKTDEAEESSEIQKEKTVTACMQDGEWNYECYLYLLLFFLEPELQLGRTMDLIQLDLSETYPDFQIRHCCTGFEAETEVYVKPVFASMYLGQGIWYGGRVFRDQTEVFFADGLRGY